MVSQGHVRTKNTFKLNSIIFSLKWKMHFWLRSRHEYILLVDSDVTERTYPGEMDSGANRECWRAWKNPG